MLPKSGRSGGLKTSVIIALVHRVWVIIDTKYDPNRALEGFHNIASAMENSSPIPIDHSPNLTLYICPPYSNFSCGANSGKKSPLLGIPNHPKILGGCLTDFFCNRWLLDFWYDSRLHLVIVIWILA